MKRLKKPYKLLLAIIIALAAYLFPKEKSDSNFFTVQEVIDGDTIKLEDNRTARYIGLDTPETKRYDLAKGWVEDVQPFAKQAEEYNRNLVKGKRVRLEFDKEKKDKYDRLLVYCFVEDAFINARLLEEGLAMLYSKNPNIKYDNIFVQAFRKAKDNKKGLWADEEVISADDAKDYIGRIVAVTGRVTNVTSTEKVITLKFGSSKKKSLFSAIIFKGDLFHFTESGISPFKDYNEREVKVFGSIKEYNNKPEIIIRDPCQVELIE